MVGAVTLYSTTKKIGVASATAVGVLACGASAWAQGTFYSASGTFFSLSGPSQYLPPGVTQGSTFTAVLDLDTGDVSGQSGSSGSVFTFPDSTLSCNFVNGSFDTQVFYTGLILDFSGNESDTTSVEINAQNANSSFSIGYSGGNAPDSTLGSMLNYLNGGFVTATITNYAILSYDNPLNGPPAVATGGLSDFELAPTPEPNPSLLVLLGGLTFCAVKVRRMFDLAGQPFHDGASGTRSVHRKKCPPAARPQPLSSCPL
jgi:hypothetical protein